MNTLSKQITPLFFKEEIQSNCYSDIKTHWLILQKQPDVQLTLAHHILYSILRGKDWRKCFTPITNQVKLDNGAIEDESLRTALFLLRNRLDIFHDFRSLIDVNHCARLVRDVISKKPFDVAYNVEANISN